VGTGDFESSPHIADSALHSDAVEPQCVTIAAVKTNAADIKRRASALSFTTGPEGGHSRLCRL